MKNVLVNLANVLSWENALYLYLFAKEGRWTLFCESTVLDFEEVVL